MQILLGLMQSDYQRSNLLTFGFHTTLLPHLSLKSLCETPTHLCGDQTVTKCCLKTTWVHSSTDLHPGPAACTLGGSQWRPVFSFTGPITGRHRTAPATGAWVQSNKYCYQESPNIAIKSFESPPRFEFLDNKIVYTKWCVSKAWLSIHDFLLRLGGEKSPIEKYPFIFRYHRLYTL